ncbi:MAG: hypothetical protein BIFFINMI_02124 [Phycisphaerae bacterium]|nr:hypothetical protein [Phycisphaerae bacterium]
MNSSQQDVLLATGGLGIVGRELCARLLRAGRRLRLLIRPADSRTADQRLADFLADEDLAGADARAVPADLAVADLGMDRAQADAALAGVSTLLHVAGSTQFDPTADGEPFATNVQGTARVLSLAERYGIAHVHHVSTAYVAGRVTGTVDPDDARRPHLFTNAYEKSKWQGEQLVRQFAARTSAVVTIHRPGIVVGRWSDGAVHGFTGLYRVLRTLDTMRSRWRSQGRPAPIRLPLVLPGRVAYTPAVVPLDWAATLMAAIVNDPACADGVWPILHPAPPTVLQLRDWTNRALEMDVGCIADEPGTPSPDPQNVWQRVFDGQVDQLRQYFGPGPLFTLGATGGLIARLGLTPPTLDEAYLSRLIDYARSRQWGRRPAARPAANDAPDATDDGFPRRYFEGFLPRRMPDSIVARVAAMTVTMGFEITGSGGGRWDLSFDAGRLTGVLAGGRGAPPDVLYRLDGRTLGEVIDGQRSPQAAFLDDRVSIDGDMELALKLAMIFQQFMNECPTTVEQLESEHYASVR